MGEPGGARVCGGAARREKRKAVLTSGYGGESGGGHADIGGSDSRSVGRGKTGSED